MCILMYQHHTANRLTGKFRFGLTLLIRDWASLQQSNKATAMKITVNYYSCFGCIICVLDVVFFSSCCICITLVLAVVVNKYLLCIRCGKVSLIVVFCLNMLLLCICVTCLLCSIVVLLPPG
jgi:hypothetical protein